MEEMKPYIETLKNKNSSWFDILDAIKNIIKIYEKEISK